MDPISLIITALSSVITALSSAAGRAAITGAAQGLAQGTAQEAYHDLKTLIKRKFAGNPKAEMVLEEYEKNPKTYEAPLKEELAEAGVDQDEEIIKKAQELLKQLKPEDSAAGKFNIKVEGDIKGIVGDISGGNINQTIS